MIWYGLCEEFSWSEVNKPICTCCFLLTFPSRKYTFLIISPKWKVHPPFIDTWPVFKVDAYSQNRNWTHIQLLLSEDCSTDIDEEANKKCIFAKEMQRWEIFDIWFPFPIGFPALAAQGQVLNLQRCTHPLSNPIIIITLPVP